MHTARKLVQTFVFLFAISFLPSAHAQVLSSITVEQLGSRVGTWTLLRADGTTLNSTDTDVSPLKYTAGVSTFGHMVLRVTPSAGMVAKISVYRGDELIHETDTHQYPFTLAANDRFRFIVQYRIANIGSLGVISESKGVIFRVKSADGRTYRGKTPWARTDLPIGKYTVYSNAAQGCYRSAPLNTTVKMEERTVVTISQTCEDAVDDRTVVRVRQSKRSLVENVIIREAIRR